MMNLKMDVYTLGLELMGTLEVYRSLIYEDKAFSAGSFSVGALITAESRALLRPDHLLWIEGETGGTIEYIQQKAGEDGLYVTVKGRLLSGILDRRILWGRYDIQGTPEEIMRALVLDCAAAPTRGDTEARKIPGLVLEEKTVFPGERIRKQKTGGTLLETLEELGTTYRVAFGVRFNPQVPQLEFWTRPCVSRAVSQVEQDPVFYSTELDDVLESEYSYDSSEYRNVTLVAGEGEGNDRIMVTVSGKAEGSTQEASGVVGIGRIGQAVIGRKGA